MNKKFTPPEIAADNTKLSAKKLIVEFETLEAEITREKETYGEDTQHMAELKELHSRQLKRALGKLIQKPRKPWARSQGELIMIRRRSDD